LDKVCSRGKYTQEEMDDAIKRILSVLKKAGKGRWMSIKEMKENGLKCKDSLIRPALRELHYRGKVVWKKIGKGNKWFYNQDSF
jgi:hypothetical protein